MDVLATRVWMGGVCAGCFRSTDQEQQTYSAETLQYAQAPQKAAAAQARPQRPQLQAQQPSSEQVCARSDEARANAAIAAQKRAEDFEKSAVGRAAKRAIAAAKAPPPPRGNRDEPGLKWTMG